MHQVINDRDPDDWFCDDDMAVVCTLTANPQLEPASRYLASRNPHRAVTLSCRPYKLRDESETPNWCPLNAAPPAAQVS